MPVPDDGSYNNWIWLPYASQCYFRGIGNQLGYPLWTMGPTAKFEPFLKLSFTTNIDKLGLPSAVAYINASDPGNSYTNALYRATASTNLAGMVIPTAFEFTRFAYESPGRLVPFVTARGLATNIYIETRGITFPPKFDGVADVYDYKSHGAQIVGSGISNENYIRYRVTNGSWIISDDLNKERVKCMSP